MEFLKKHKTILILLLLFPFLLANKECKRAATWGNDQAVSLWAENHVGMDESMSCADCHDDERSPKKPPKSHNSHDISWKREHGKFSSIKYGFRNQNMCSLCHKDSFCTSCHFQDPPKDHTRFWRLRGHGVAIGLDRTRCSVCHVGADFCERCHSQTQPISHNALWGSTRNLHCQNCHFPLTTGNQSCSTCHRTAAHSSAPAAPASIAFHRAGVDCTSCHTGAALSHPNNGETCTNCHTLP